MASIYFGGSRSLAPSAKLGQVVQAVLSAGHSVHVGCSAGADQQVILACLRSSLFSQVQVFSAFAQCGAGSWSGSAVQVVQAFERAGGSVVWSAGGHVQRVPLAGRLIQRSIAAFQGCSAAVFFSPGFGSLSVAFHAFSAGIPVFAFGEKPAPVSAQGGGWVRSSFQGFACWQWQGAQLSLF